MNKITHFFTRKYNQVKKVIKYLPVLWNSYDFDYQYAIELFQMKLEDIADFMESDNAISVESKNNAKRIRTTIKLMKKVYDEEYSTEYLDTLREMYGDDVVEFEFVKLDGEDELFRLKKKYEDWDNSEEVKKIETELFHKSQQKQQRAHKLLWELVEHNIRHWWD